MKLKWIKIVYMLSALSFVTAVLADNDDSPVKMLNTIASHSIDQLNQAEEKISKGEVIPVRTVHSIVNSILLPHVDLDNISRAVLGRNTWEKATASQKAEFKQQFTDLLIDTYASGLAMTSKFNKRQVKFFPIRGGYKGKTIVQVNSKVYPEGAPALSVVYSLERKNGQWLLYDVSVEGVSLVQSYRAQFTAMLENQGLDSLLTTLASHNKTLATQYNKAGNS